MAEELRKAEKGSNVTEDHSQVKHPPPEGMLLPVVPGLDPAVVIPPSTEIEQNILEPTIAPAAQLATTVSSNILLLKNMVKAKNFLCDLPNQIK